MIQHQTCEPLFLEVPHDTLGQTRRRGGDLTGQASGNVVAGEHHLVDSGVGVGLVELDPFELGGREVAGEVEQTLETDVGADVLGGLVADLDGPAVAPDDGRAEDVEVLIDEDQAVHLIGDADGPSVGQ